MHIFIRNYSKHVFIDDASLFVVNQVENTATVSLARILTDELVEGRTYFQCELQATNAVNSRGFAVLIVDIVQPDPIILPKFTQPAYRGSLDLDLVLTFENVLLIEETFGPDVTFALEGGTLNNCLKFLKF